MTRPLGKEYFERYGADTPGYEKTAYSRSWQRYTFSVDEIIAVYRDHFRRRPETLLDLGAADGALMKKSLRRGLDCRGLENSPYILGRIRDPELKARIHKADAAREIRNIKAASYDIVVECVAQYLPPRSLDAYLRNVARVCGGMACLLVDARNYDGIRGGPHTGVRTFETKTWWKRKMRESGFRKSEKDFYFFKG